MFINAENKGGDARIILGMGLDTITKSLDISASIEAAGPILALAIIAGMQNALEGI